MPDAYRNFAFRIDVATAPVRVWRAWSDPALLPRWTAPGATLKAAEGGAFRLQFDPHLAIDAHVDVCIAEQRLRLILLPPKGLPSFDGVEVDDFVFERAAQSLTRVRLMSTGLPRDAAWDDYYARKRVHWQRALARLKVFVEKSLDVTEGSS
jgi:uncharacterized protein YndB with AHSA1/START domain